MKKVYHNLPGKYFMSIIVLFLAMLPAIAQADYIVPDSIEPIQSLAYYQSNGYNITVDSNGEYNLKLENDDGSTTSLRFQADGTFCFSLISCHYYDNATSENYNIHYDKDTYQLIRYYVDSYTTFGLYYERIYDSNHQLTHETLRENTGQYRTWTHDVSSNTYQVNSNNVTSACSQAEFESNLHFYDEPPLTVPFTVQSLSTYETQAPNDPDITITSGGAYSYVSIAIGNKISWSLGFNPSDGQLKQIKLNAQGAYSAQYDISTLQLELVTRSVKNQYGVRYQTEYNASGVALRERIPLSGYGNGNGPFTRQISQTGGYDQYYKQLRVQINGTNYVLSYEISQEEYEAVFKGGVPDLTPPSMTMPRSISVKTLAEYRQLALSNTDIQITNQSNGEIRVKYHQSPYDYNIDYSSGGTIIRASIAYRPPKTNNYPRILNYVGSYDPPSMSLSGHQRITALIVNRTYYEHFYSDGSPMFEQLLISKPASILYNHRKDGSYSKSINGVEYAITQEEYEAVLNGGEPDYTTAIDPSIVDQGTWGTNLTWTLDNEGKLTVSGTGEMPTQGKPWNSFDNRIKTVRVGYGITSISTQAFGYLPNLTSATIADTVQTIGNYAFTNCYKLESITMPENVTSIGYCAFRMCRELTSINFPESLTSIGDYAFVFCNKLTTVTPTAAAQTEHTRCYEGSLYVFSLPATITEIGYGAFINTAIGQYVDFDADFEIPTMITSIEEEAFTGITATHVLLKPQSDNKIEIGKKAFANCPNLRYFELNDYGSGTKLEIDPDAFYGCSNLTLVGELNDDLKKFAQDNNTLSYMENEHYWGDG